MIIKVKTKNILKQYDVENGFQAVKAFFKDIRQNRIGLDQVGLIGFWYRADGENGPLPQTLPRWPRAKEIRGLFLFQAPPGAPESYRVYILDLYQWV
jgi:hypothetical protein